MRTLLLILALALPAMAGREFVSSSSQLGVGSIDPISPPLTLAAWCRPVQDTAAQIVLAVGTTTNATERAQIFLNGTDPSDRFIGGVINAAGTADNVTNSLGGSIGTWAHVGMVVASATELRIYGNGTKATRTIPTITLNGLNQVALGARKSTSFGAFWDGTIAETAVWSVALTDAEMTSLASGAAPFMVRPSALVFYAPLTGREAASEWNLFGAAVILTNSPAAGTTHPRIYRP